MTAPEFVHRDDGTSRHIRCGSIIPTSHVTRHKCPPLGDAQARREAS